MHGHVTAGPAVLDAALMSVRQLAHQDHIYNMVRKAACEVATASKAAASSARQHVVLCRNGHQLMH